MKWTDERKIERSLLAKSCSYGKWMLGKKHSKETKEKISAALRGRPFSGVKANWNGKKHSIQSKLRMSAAAKVRKVSFETRLKKSLAQRGEESRFWKGGITALHYQIRHSFEYKQWRRLVFERDNFTCQFCRKKGIPLEADHIKQFAYFPELRFELTNGRTLCEECHRKTDTYGSNRYKTKRNPRVEIEVEEFSIPLPSSPNVSPC